MSSLFVSHLLGFSFIFLEVWTVSHLLIGYLIYATRLVRDQFEVWLVSHLLISYFIYATRPVRDQVVFSSISQVETHWYACR